jgi:hypothetical protein
MSDTTGLVPDVPEPTCHADESGAAIHVPDPTGMTSGTTVVLAPETVADLYTRIRAAQLGATTAGEL